MTEREPQTKAAQRLLADLLGRYGQSVLDPVSDELTREALVAIEQEARADLAAAIVAAVEGLPGYRDPRYSGRYEATGIVDRAAVLNAIREASDDRLPPDRSQPCDTDDRCYRWRGHPGEHAYAGGER